MRTVVSELTAVAGKKLKSFVKSSRSDREISCNTEKRRRETVERIGGKGARRTV